MTLTKEQKIVATIIQKAWDDATFKRELFKNPRITIENFIGKKKAKFQGRVFFGVNVLLACVVWPAAVGGKHTSQIL